MRRKEVYGQVHRGFYEAFFYSDTQPCIFDQIVEELLLDKYRNKALFVTGHSLGVLPAVRMRPAAGRVEDAPLHAPRDALPACKQPPGAPGSHACCVQPESMHAMPAAHAPLRQVALWCRSSATRWRSGRASPPP